LIFELNNLVVNVFLDLLLFGIELLPYLLGRLLLVLLGLLMLLDNLLVAFVYDFEGIVDRSLEAMV
jgi:hypothetical protein